VNVYVIVKYNRKFFIYTSRSDKEWPPSKEMLVSDISHCSSGEDTLAVQRRNIIQIRNGAHQAISVKLRTWTEYPSKQKS